MSETQTRTFNLLQSPWIPARRRSGRLDWITPAQIVEVDDPPVSIETSRPDFDGGIWQFLIGLLQTLYLPASEDDWGDRYRDPPAVEELTEALRPALGAFWLDGPGPRYMQELGLETFEPDAVSVQELLGESLAARLFFKSESVERLGLCAAAMALTTLQMHAWGGGRGYKTALRGAGTVTSLLAVRGETLFRNLWLNVLSGEDWSARVPGADGIPLLHAFPWMLAARTDERGELIHVSTRSHRAVHFWAMPRRAWLQFAPGGRCDVLALSSPLTATTVLRRPYGLDYQGTWHHPLSPHQQDKEGTLYPGRISGNRIPYQEWPGLVLGQRESEHGRVTEPAAVVDVYRVRGRGRAIREAASEVSVGLRLFGFQMPPGQAKVFGWLEQETPLLGATVEEARYLASHAAQLVASADRVRGSLVSACRQAIRRRAEDLKWDSSIVQSLSRSFWARTEGAFLLHLEQLRPLIDAEGQNAFTEIRRGWLKTLQAEAMAQFAEASQQAADFRATDVARVARAHNRLRSETQPWVPWLMEAVGLPQAEAPSKAKSKPRSRAAAKAPASSSAASRQKKGKPS